MAKGASGPPSPVEEEVGRVLGGSPASPSGGGEPASETRRPCPNSVASEEGEAAAVGDVPEIGGQIAVFVEYFDTAVRKLSWEGSEEMKRTLASTRPPLEVSEAKIFGILE